MEFNHVFSGPKAVECGFDNFRACQVKKMKRPNFFIVGAPKCGTTALSEYLRTHPQVFFSSPKEPNYFAIDFSPQFRRYHTEEEYLSQCFRGANETHRAVGEGSAAYLISQVALENIRKFDSNARIIVMLRNPVDMLYSYHSELVWACREDVIDFEQAWHMQESRRIGKSIPDGCPDPKLLQYAHVCSLGSHMERVYASFPRQHVLPILFDDFITNTAGIYKIVLKFLKLSDDCRVDFPQLNANKVHRFYSFMNFYESVSKRLDWPKNKVKSIFGVNKLGVRDLLFTLNRKTIERKPLSGEMRAKFIRVFCDEIGKLEKILKRDLKSWIH